MKKLITLLLIVAVSATAFAQFKLTGRIENYSGKEVLQINIPVIFGFHKENSIDIPIAKDGSFNITLPVKVKKFGNLIFQRKLFTLLLMPSKNLLVDLNVSDTSIKILAGAALAENKLMQEVDVQEYPFFLANEGNNKFSNLSLNQLKEQVLKPYFSQRDKKIELINHSNLSLADKDLISSEVKFIAYNYLNDLARTQIKNRAVVDSLILEVFDNTNGKPDVENAGPQYFAFVDNYIRYLETKAFNAVKTNNIKPNEPIPYYEISLDSANHAYEKYGKPYLRWICSSKNFPPAVVEEYNYQQIVNLYEEKNIRQLGGLAAVFQKAFPSGKYSKVIEFQINDLKNKLTLNEKNSNIKVLAGYEQLTSMQEVVNTLKGKVVYLDIWGTWCGPCKEELRYLPQLRAAFKNKDVVFVYLDMDEDNKDADWKEFIKVNDLQGLHLRKNRKTIAPFWKELLENNTDKAEYYPQYFIFDKEGKLAISKALRPSDKEELYTQIKSVLKKNYSK